MRTKNIISTPYTVTTNYPDAVAYSLDNQYIEITYTMGALYFADKVEINVDSTYSLSVPFTNLTATRSGRVVFPLRGIVEQLPLETAKSVTATLTYHYANNAPQTLDLLPVGTTIKVRKGVTLAGRRHDTDFAAVMPSGVTSIDRYVKDTCVVLDDNGIVGLISPGDSVSLEMPSTFCAFADIPSIDYVAGTMPQAQGYCVGVVIMPVEIDGDVVDMSVIKFCSVNMQDDERYSFFFLGDDPDVLSSSNLDVYGYSDPDDLTEPLTAIDRVNDGNNDMRYFLVPTDRGDVLCQIFNVFNFCADGIKYKSVRYTNADGVQRYAVGKVLSRGYEQNGGEVRLFGQLNSGVGMVQYSAGVSVTLAFGNLQSPQHFEDILFADDIEVQTVDGYVPAVIEQSSATIAVTEKYDKTITFKLQQ